LRSERTKERPAEAVWVMVVVLVMSVTADVETAVPATRVLLAVPTRAPLLVVWARARVRPRRKMARAATNFMLMADGWESV
jgi:hypothetical protein